MKTRLKNYGLWLALASLVLLVLQQFGIDIAPEKYQLFVDSVLGILVMLGVVSNPTSGNGFKDAE